MGRVIRELREAAGLTQAELGDLVGIKGTMIYKYEAGISCVNIDMAFKLASALKIKPDVFVLKLMGFDKKEPAFQDYPAEYQDLLERVCTVLSSKTHYAVSLMHNINSFFEGVAGFKEMRNSIEDMRTRLDSISSTDTQPAPAPAPEPKTVPLAMDLHKEAIEDFDHDVMIQHIAGKTGGIAPDK